MKYFLSLLMVLFIAMPMAVLADCQSFYDVDPSTAAAKARDQKDAQKLKKAGDELVAGKVVNGQKSEPNYLGAAEQYASAAALAPVPEVSAMYYWKAAAAETGHLDSNNDWATNGDKITADQKTKALAWLDKVDSILSGDESPYCHTGVNIETLKVLSANVRACIEGHCN